jgi:hypothetical protein
MKRPFMTTPRIAFGLGATLFGAFVLLAGCKGQQSTTAENTSSTAANASDTAATGTSLRGGQPTTREAPKFDNAQFARSSASRARADLMICRNLGAGLTNGGNLAPKELASTLHGTWLRRLTLHGVPIETDSYIVFDMSNPAKGSAMMIDRANLGADRFTPGPRRKSTAADLREAVDPKRIEAIESGMEPGGELTLPMVTSALWDVSIDSGKETDKRTQGLSGATINLNGEYHGTGSQFPEGGLNFTERATFYKEGSAMAVVTPWISPSNGYGGNYQWDGVSIAGNPAPDMLDTAATIGNSARDFGHQSPKPLTLTFISCDYQFVDTYVKISSTPAKFQMPNTDIRSLQPSHNGVDMRTAFARLKAAGSLDKLPEIGTRANAPVLWPADSLPKPK